MNRVLTPTLHPAVPPGAGSKAALVSAARLILTNCGIEMSPRRLHRLVQSYFEEVRHRGFGFFEYFTTAIQIDADAKRRLLSDPAIAKAITYADPTGEQATNRVMREHHQ